MSCYTPPEEGTLEYISEVEQMGAYRGPEFEVEEVIVNEPRQDVRILFKRSTKNAHINISIFLNGTYSPFLKGDQVSLGAINAIINL